MKILGGLYPLLQVAIELRPADVERLKRSVALGRASASMYRCLAGGKATDSISTKELHELVLAIAALPDGFDVAVEIFYMRIHFEHGNIEGITAHLAATGCALMERVVFAKDKNDLNEHRLGEICQRCLKGVEGASVVTSICERLKTAVRTHATYPFYHRDLIHGLFQAQPVATLNGLCRGDQNELHEGVRILHDTGKLPIVSDEDLVAW